jgi:hypothetical protein
MEFVMEKVVLGQAFLRVLEFLSLMGIILPIILWVLGDKKLPVLGDKKLPVLALTAVHFKTPRAIENVKNWGKNIYINFQVIHPRSVV